MAEFLRAGLRVLLPFGYNHRYDLVLDVDGRFIRIQIKTGRVVRNGAIQFNACSCDSVTRVRKDYHGQADWFAVYCENTRKVYLVPVSSVSPTVGVLRIRPPKSKQTKGIRMAEDFELDKMIQRL